MTSLDTTSRGGSTAEQTAILKHFAAQMLASAETQQSRPFQLGSLSLPVAGYW